eukprot:COSAG02_NODE_30277_length_554_cov_0.903297_1_plen_123_part_00
MYILAILEQLATVAAHSLARGTKRRGKVRRIASPKTPLTPLPVFLNHPEQFLVRIPVRPRQPESTEEIRENELKRRDVKRLQQSFLESASCNQDGGSPLFDSPLFDSPLLDSSTLHSWTLQY